jgi:HSP20 family molecular chaperone IbpA
MALYPSNVFKSFNYPTQMQSIFEDFNDLFSDALFHPFYELERNLQPRRHRAAHHRYFSTAVKLNDFRADEVAVKVEERKVRIHAKHQDGEDLSEVRKTVSLPEDVDADKVETRMTKEGFLVVRAPYIRAEKTGSGDANSALTQLGARSWDEMRSLLRGPGITSVHEQLVKDEKTGETRFQVSVPVRDFHPEEVTVRQIGDRVVVRAEHRDEREGQLVHRSMQREFTLPQGVDREHMVSRLTDCGTLQIEAPAPNLALPEPRDIPVENRMEVAEK